jgi:sporulation protein YlmC with PRC-barrel domain
MKTSALALASALLLAGSTQVLAQTATTPPPASTPPPAASPSGQPMWYSHQADEMRASKLIGTKVVNTANETIGDINEIVLSKDGKVAAVIVGVGGFLGMGEREVAMNFESIRMSRDQNNNLVLTANATKDTLKDAPAWRWDTAKK